MSDVVTNHARRVYSVIQSGASSEAGGIAGRIAVSWKRCVNEYGLDPADPREPAQVSAAELADRQTGLADLLMLARPEMASLSRQIASSGYAIVLTDSDGVVLSCFVESAVDGLAATSGFTPGAIWTERTQGTNALGTCLAERQPVIVHDAEHFLTRNLGLTCSAAPIFDHHGALIAVLDASGVPQMSRQKTLVLVSRAAQRIENRLFLHRFRSDFVLRFHGRPDFVDSPGEGTIAFSAAGTVLAANRAACLQLGHASPAELIERDIGDLFNESAQVLADLSSSGGSHPAPIIEARHGGRFFGTVQPPAGGRAIIVSRPAGRPIRRVILPAEVATTPLDALDTGDPVMTFGIRRAKRVLNKDIPILLYGETGSGKEVFAKAMHRSSERAGRPFVALNCASIPETLIESELFGYKAGAFTGAARDGRRGKIFLANGGTLFLDEIGDMPVHLQARLLRALEEREVLPLGGDEPIKVDMRLISATHCNLPEKIKTGEFRPDLYYRLHGFALTLPPLRERGDRRELIRRVLAEEAEGSPIEIDEAALDRLDRYSWPGNLRELRNVLRTVLALREGSVVTEFDLPEAVRTDSNPLLPEPAPGSAPAPESDLSPLESAEREALVRELDRQHWNITNVARRLKISRNTLYRKMQRLAIRDPNKKEKVLH